MLIDWWTGGHQLSPYNRNHPPSTPYYGIRKWTLKNSKAHFPPLILLDFLDTMQMFLILLYSCNVCIVKLWWKCWCCVVGCHIYTTENLAGRDRTVVHLSDLWEIFTCCYDSGEICDHCQNVITICCEIDHSDLDYESRI